MHTFWNVLLLVFSLLFATFVALGWAGQAGNRGSVGVMLGVVLGLLAYKLLGYFVPGSTWLNYSWWIVALAVVVLGIVLLPINDNICAFIASVFVLLLVLVAWGGFRSNQVYTVNAAGVCKKTGYQVQHNADGTTVTYHGKAVCKVPEVVNQAAATTPHPTSCSGGFRVKLDPNKQHRFLSSGVKTNPTAGSVPAFRREIHDWLAHDPVGLIYYYNSSPSGKLTPIPSASALVQGGIVANGNCYSAMGVARFTEWAFLWKTAVITPVAAMPPGWANSGVTNGAPYSTTPPSGNTAGWMVSYQGASGQTTGQVGVMKRCGNPVTPHPLPPPQAPPASPPPPPVHHVPPPATTTTTTPSKQLKNCRKKDPDPNTATKLCDSRNVNSLPATNHRHDPGRTPGAPSDVNHPVVVVKAQETPTTVSTTGSTATPYGTNTPNGNVGSSGSSSNPTDTTPPPAQGVTHPEPHPGTTPPPAVTLPPQCLDPSDAACGTG